MKDLHQILRIMTQGQARSWWQGGALAFLVLVMGVSLLGLSGWFITAAAAAGLAGTGAVFDVFRPSAMVRFLALGRTVTRYGERVLTHDTVLRALAALRVRLLRGLLQRPYPQLVRLRSSVVMNRLMADIDALDGVPLRLVLPLFAGLGALFVSGIAIWMLVHPSLAAVMVFGNLAVAGLVFWRAAKGARPMARRAEAAAQSLRGRFVDLITLRADLAVYGQLPATQSHVARAAHKHASDLRKLDLWERAAGAGISLGQALIMAAMLAIGGELALADVISPAQAAIGVFAALALGEALMPLRRVVAEYGRMERAASRVIALVPAEAPAAKDAPLPESGALQAQGLCLKQGPRTVFQDISLQVQPGESLVVTGPSGSGKSSLLALLAGAMPPDAGEVTFAGAQIHAIPDTQLRDRITLVPQRAALLQGSIAGNLRLVAPKASDDDLWAALRAAQLEAVIRARGGLTAPLGPRGGGLSGGEARRLVLARAILRRPAVLLLDEPTEGLDHLTAQKLHKGLRAALPQAAIIIAAHRMADRDAANKVLCL